MTQDQLRGDAARLLRQLEDARTAQAAASSDAATAAQPQQARAAAAEADAAQQRAVKQAVEAIAQRLRESGTAADSADVVRAQAERILNQSQTVRLPGLLCMH